MARSEEPVRTCGGVSLVEEFGREGGKDDYDTYILAKSGAESHAMDRTYDVVSGAEGLRLECNKYHCGR